MTVLVLLLSYDMAVHSYCRRQGILDWLAARPFPGVMVSHGLHLVPQLAIMDDYVFTSR